jgi:hypothetical protein
MISRAYEKPAKRRLEAIDKVPFVIQNEQSE